MKRQDSGEKGDRDTLSWVPSCMTQEVQTNDLKEIINKLIPDGIRKGIEKACQSVHPMLSLLEKSKAEAKA